MYGNDTTSEESMATIKEVAKLAGVGTSTVSRYFQKGSYISESAAKRIEKACQELNYSPNALARAMKYSRSNTIGLMIPTISNPFFTQLIEMIEKTFMKYGYKTVLCNTNGNIELEQNYLDMAISNCFDGIIFITGSQEFEELEYDIPTLILDRKSVRQGKVITVISNHRQGAILGSEHLIACGCKKILYLTSLDINHPAQERQAAFEEVMSKRGVSYGISAFDLMSDEEKEKTFLKYDGIFAWNDVTAIECMHYLHTREIKIPQDIQLVGYDNIKMSEWVYPRLTTISQPIHQLGEIASHYMLDLIEKKITPPLEIVLENTLVIRESTKGQN